MRNYELMVVIDSSSDAEKIDQTVTKIQEMIIGKGGKDLTVDNWGRRRLAYEIQRRQYGFYVLFRFELEPKEIKDLNRLLRLNSMVLRHLVLVLDPKAIVAPISPLREDFEVEIPKVVEDLILEEEEDVVIEKSLAVEDDETPTESIKPKPGLEEAEPENNTEK
jgi:small subunit ribosomal protein S6